MRSSRAVLFALGVAACSDSPRAAPAAATALAIESAIPAPSASAAPDTSACEDPDEALFASPKAPNAEAPLRVIAVTEAANEGALSITRADGSEIAHTVDRHGGPPTWWSIAIDKPVPGKYRATLTRANQKRACREIVVTAEAPAIATWGPFWPIERSWGRVTEDLYSAWVEKLFDAPLEEQPTWPALHDVLRDASRNFLHDHLGAGEDDLGPRALVIDPDCADLPYFLRAYFAFKLGLPFGYSSCTRGGIGAPPKCVRWRSYAEGATHRKGGTVARFGNFLRIDLADAVHSGNGRVPASDDAGDYYPVALSEQSLRPGTVYADPYGHMLVVARRIAQTETSGGILLAVDGQPDGTIARRRFWRGNFLFAIDPALGSPGFKRFRPVILEGRRMRAMTNAEIANAHEFAETSLEQYGLGVDGFYDRMEDVLSPAPLDPARALRETIQALEEQVRGRLLSVENGEKYKASGGASIDMPDGAEIFETTGPWEDFSTPSRDLRLLIATDIVRNFSDRVARRPERFAMPAGKTMNDVRAELDAILKEEMAARTFAYKRSDGSTWKLTLGDVLARATELEVAYDPNDCVEVRWGASARSDEMSTCRHRAPGDQRERMAKARAWFHERRRPARE